MTATTIQWIAAFLFAGALIHTFSASYFERLAHHSKHHSGLFHLLGEVEAVFGIWALFLVIAMAFSVNLDSAVEYVDTRHYTEPLFVFVIMVVAASRPVLDASRLLVESLARLMPVNKGVAFTWLGLFMVPLLGSLITEPAAMTLAALLLRDVLFSKAVPNSIRYWGLGVLFVNIYHLLPPRGEEEQSRMMLMKAVPILTTDDELLVLLSKGHLPTGITSMWKI